MSMTQFRATVVLVLALTLAVAAGTCLPGCRSGGDPSAGNGGSGGAGSGGGGQDSGGGSPGGSGGSGGGALPPLEVVVYDDRLSLGTADTPSGLEPYLETAVEASETVLVGQGDVTVTLTWAQRVRLEDLESFLSLDPVPESAWNWLEEWGDGSVLQFRYRASEAAEGARVTLDPGLPLGGSDRLEEEFAFTITRVTEPAVTMTVAGLPWVTSPYERLFTGYAVPTGSQVITLEFSHPPDQVSVEERLGLRAAPDGRWLSFTGERLEAAAEWSGDRTLELTLDLAEGDRVVLDTNGALVPGHIPLARQSPLVMEGRPPRSLAVFGQPTAAGSSPTIVDLPVPAARGRLSPDGNWVLLWEHAPFAFPGEDTSDHRLVPWLARAADGTARCLDGAVAFNWVHRCADSGGWAADGRYIIPEHSRIVAVTPGPGEVRTAVLDGPTPDGNWKYLSYSVAPDGGRLAWLEIARDAQGRHAEGMTLVVLDLAGGERSVYPDAAPTRLYDGVYYETPTIVWLPLGQVGLWRDGPAGQPGRVLLAFDEAGGRFAPTEFTAPDGKPLSGPQFWTIHADSAAWQSSGVAIGTEPTATGSFRQVLVTSAGRFELELPGGLDRAALSPDGRWLAAQPAPGPQVLIIDRSTGETVRSLDGQLVGWGPDGALWLLVTP